MRFKAFGPGAAVMAAYPNRAGPGGAEGGIDVVDLATGKVKVAIRAPDLVVGEYLGCDFSPDGKLLAINGERDAVRLFDAATGKLVRELRPPNASTSSRNDDRGIRFSPDGRFLVAREHPGRPGAIDVPQAVVWSVADGKRLLEVANLGSPPLSPDNRALVIGNPRWQAVLPRLADREGRLGQEPRPTSGAGRQLPGRQDAGLPRRPSPIRKITGCVSVPELPEPLTGKGRRGRAGWPCAGPGGDRTACSAGRTPGRRSPHARSWRSGTRGSD